MKHLSSLIILTLSFYFNIFSYHVVAQLPVDTSSSGWISISSPEKITIIQPGNKSPGITTSSLLLTTRGYNVKLNSKPIKEGVFHLRAKNLYINNQHYRGPASLSIKKDRICVYAQKSPQKAETIWRSAQIKSSPALPSCIKVLIDEKRIEEHTHAKDLWCLTSTTGFYFFNPFTKKSEKKTLKNTIKISFSDKTIHIDKTKYPFEQLCIKPLDGHAGVNGTRYHGMFTIAKRNNSIYLINHVELEEYVYSVLKTESWPGWPIEVNKAFAIASRSYVLAQIHRMKKSDALYHVKNTNEHQTYRGMHETSGIRKAVTHTKGMVLTYANAPALTMFDSCCGGIIPAHIEDFEFEKAPYLARKQPCTFCKRCKIYSWKKEIPIESVHKSLAHLFEEKTKLKEIKIDQKDKAGLVTKLQIKKGNKHHAIDGKKFYSAMKDIKSFCYTVQKKADKLIFEGKGYGHHIGICQWGAREMVRDGWPYKRILDFYYPGTKLSNLVNA